MGPDFTSRDSAPVSSNSPNHFISAVSDAPIASVTVETLSAPDQFALWLLREHQRLGTASKLNGTGKRAQSTAWLLFHSMCLYHAEWIDGYRTPIVAASREEIAASVGVPFKSTFSAIRRLADPSVGAIRIRFIDEAHPNLGRYFEICLPPGSSPEVAEAIQNARSSRDSTPASARAGGSDSLQGHAVEGSNPLTDPEIRSRSGSACPPRERLETPEPDFSAENADRTRAMISPSAAITASTAAAQVEGGGKEGDRPAIDDISLIAGELARVGLSCEQAMEYAGRPGISVQKAVALRIEMMANRRWPRVIPIALAILNGTSKHPISGVSMNEAARELGMATASPEQAPPTQKPNWMTPLAWDRWSGWSAADRQRRLAIMATKYSGSASVAASIEAAASGKSLPASWVIEEMAKLASASMGAVTV
jgi:hypothetical protein